MTEYWFGCKMRSKCDNQFCYDKGDTIPSKDFYIYVKCPECECVTFSIIHPGTPLYLRNCTDKSFGALCEKTVPGNN